MSVFKTLLATAAVATALMAGSVAQATVLVSDNFESYHPTVHGTDRYDLNFTAFTSGLHVEDGTVDLLGSPNAWSLTGASNFIDLDGSTNNGGILRTNVFSFNAGDVITLSLSMAGNQRGGTDEWDFGFQSAGGPISFLNLQTIGVPAPFGNGDGTAGPGCCIGSGMAALAANSPWTNYSISFTAGNSGSFTAYVATTSADNVGPLVDDFLLTTSAAIPEPAAWAMMIMGFGLAGALLRRRRGFAAVA